MNLIKYKDKIEKIINEHIESSDLKIYELNFVNDYESEVIQLLVENKDSKNKFIDFDQLSKLNKYISDSLDELSELEEEYILEVSSAGAEKIIKTKDELIDSVNKYLFVKVKENIENDLNDFYGELISFEDDEFHFKFFIKGRIKKYKTNWKNISFVRNAIKF